MAAKKKAAATVAKWPSTKKEVPLASLIATCLRGISELYPGLYPGQDPAPGLVLSFLPSGEFYASFARYQGGQKIVTNSARGKTLEEAVHSLVLAWKAGTRHARDLAAMSRSIDKIMVGDTINLRSPQPFKTGTRSEVAGIKGRKSLTINLENMRGGLIDEIKSLVYRG